MPRALTPAPTDRGMWKKLLRRCHPDGGGDGDLFVWVRALQEHVSCGCGEPRPRIETTTGERVPYSSSYNQLQFRFLTTKALYVAEELPEPYAGLLRLLEDCDAAPEEDTALYLQQQQGATYKTLAAIAHRAGMSKQQRSRWYEIARDIPMAQRMAGHIIQRLQDRAA